jgi:hypothetical protein
LPRLRTGSKPIDGGHYIFTPDQRKDFIIAEPSAEPYLRPYVGSREFLQGGERHILWLGDAEPHELAPLPLVRERIKAVKDYRLASDSRPTQQLADTPTRYHINVIPDEPFLVVPEASSERREYIPIAWLEPPVVPSNLVKIILGADKCLFAIMSSAMHMSWVRHIGGRLKSDYRYSIGLVYNPYPMPNISDAAKKRIEGLADAVLDARANHASSSLSNLYDPELMPADLIRAHRALDRAVDKLYKRGGFSSDRERVEHLFGMYEKMVSPLTTSKKKRRKQTKKKRTSR